MRRLLSHTAGTNMLSVPCFAADSARPDEIAVLDGRVGDRGRVELTREPGSAWSYSGGGFTMLQLAASQVAKMPFDAFMQAAVLGPLGMRDSYFGPPRTVAATAYDEGGKPLRPVQCVGEAAAGLVTSARDIARLLVEYGRVRRGASALLPAPWLDTLSLPIIATSFVVDGKALDMGDTQMGLGHFVHVARGGRRMLFHSGGNPGVGAYLLVDLDRDGGLFVAVNSDNARAVMQAILTAWGAWNDVDPPTFF